MVVIVILQNDTGQIYETSEKRRTNEVGPNGFAGTDSELYVTSNVSTRRIGPRHRQYDSYDARFLSFITWPLILHLTELPKYRGFLAYW